jgi:hypothetical protein
MAARKSKQQFIRFHHQRATLMDLEGFLEKARLRPSRQIQGHFVTPGAQEQLLLGAQAREFGTCRINGLARDRKLEAARKQRQIRRQRAA